MSLNRPQYQIFTIDLGSTGILPAGAIGQMDIQMRWSYLRMIAAFDGTGTTALAAVIGVQLSPAGADVIPMQINSLVEVNAPYDFVRLTWTVQAGLTAKILLSDQDQGQGVRCEAPPTTQLITTAAAGSISGAAVVVGVASTLINAANASRRAITIRNNGTAIVYLGPIGVTVANGLPLAVGDVASFDNNTAAIYGISGTAAQDVRYLSEG